jgi:ribose transport system substrate-binding protein
MPPALQAVHDGELVATVRNPSSRIHGGAIVAGVGAVLNGSKTGVDIPKHIVADGPLVTKDNAQGLSWLEEQYLC